MKQTNPLVDAILKPFKGRQKHTTILSVDITSHCNLRCPECAANISGILNPAHYDVNEIQAAAAYLQGFEILGLTGGEPTMYPSFKQIVPLLKEWFGVSKLLLATNGYKVIEYKDILHHFDDIFISRYAHNQRENDFIAKHFLGRPPGPSIHLTTARRARKPSPCFRSNITKLSFGRLYPCCFIIDGYEYIGVPLSKDFRETVFNIPLPCLDCCFAEEKRDGDMNAFELQPLEKEINEEARAAKGLPRLRHDIAIYGIDLDSWMSREADIRLCRHPGATRLRIVFESHAPRGVYPITLIFKNESDKVVHTHAVTEAGGFETLVELTNILTHSGYSWMKLLCDKTFVPHALDCNNQDKRELGMRVVSLRYA
jgi:hypothetical protein